MVATYGRTMAISYVGSGVIDTSSNSITALDEWTGVAP